MRTYEQTREFAASIRWSEFPAAQDEEFDHIARRSEACIAATEGSPGDRRTREIKKVLQFDVTIVIESNL